MATHDKPLPGDAVDRLEAEVTRELAAMMRQQAGHDILSVKVATDEENTAREPQPLMIVLTLRSGDVLRVDVRHLTGPAAGQSQGEA